jgi:glycosyltransferase involved in cell wall biosynthesis
MKVLYLAPPAGASERLTAYTFMDEELQALDRAGVELSIINPDIVRDVTRGQIAIRALPPGKLIRERRRTITFLLRRFSSIAPIHLRSFAPSYHSLRIERFAADLIKHEQIDMIHSHFGWPGGFGGMLAHTETGVPLMASFRGMDLLMDRAVDYGLRRSPAYDAAVRALLQTAHRTTYVSSFLRQVGIRLGAPPSKARVVMKGVDVQKFNDSGDRDILWHRWGVRPPIILSVAGLLKRKRVDDILRALTRLKDRHDFTFIVCGDGPELPRLTTLAQQLDLSTKTRFVGNIDRSDISSFFAACDIFVLASQAEASGNVLLEAMASAKPVVCTDGGGPPEYVRHEMTGFVVPVGDVTALAEKIGLLLAEPQLRKHLGDRARAVAIEHFSYDRMVREILRHYAELQESES